MVKIEELIRMVYRFWRKKHKQADLLCPDEETLVCFSEGTLPRNESKMIQEHLVSCSRCSEVVSLFLQRHKEQRDVPEVLINKAKSLIEQKLPTSILEIAIAIKEKALEILGTTADIILENEILPLPVLRSRKITEFQEEIGIIEEFINIKINILIQKMDRDSARLNINLIDKTSLKPLDDLRLMLMKDKKEIESYELVSGNAVFDKVGRGDYEIQILRKEEILGVINLKIK